MTRPTEETCGVEATVQLSASELVLGWNLGRLTVKTFGLVVVPLLLIGEKLDDDQEEHRPTEQGVILGECVAIDARGQQKDVCGGGDEPEEDLILLAYR